MNTKSKTRLVEDQILADLLAEGHIATSVDTPLRADAFQLTDDEKIKRIGNAFKEIMLTLGLDLNDDSLSGTPHRVAKMYVKEIFSGLNPANKPEVTLFENKFNYGQMLVEKNITLFQIVSTILFRCTERLM